MVKPKIYFSFKKMFSLDGTSPSPMLFTTTTNPSKTDVSSRHQQIIDAFLNDGKKKDIFRNK
jgi:hypothetical protein